MKMRSSVILFIMMTALLLPAAGMAEDRKGEDTKKKVWAVVGDEVIDEACVESQIRLLPRSVQARMGKETLRSKVIDDLIEQKILAYGARQARLEEAPEVRFEIKDSTEKILAEAYVRYLRRGAAVSEEEIEQYYKGNPDQYRVSAQVKLRHLVVKDGSQAQKILADLKKGGDFAKIAGENSTYITRNKDGDLGWVKKGMLMQELEEKAFAMKKGDLSDVIRIKDEYHIIRVEDRREPGLVPLEEVEDRISIQLQREKQKQVVEDARKALREKLAVKIFREKKIDTGAPGQ